MCEVFSIIGASIATSIASAGTAIAGASAAGSIMGGIGGGLMAAGAGLGSASALVGLGATGLAIGGTAAVASSIARSNSQNSSSSGTSVLTQQATTATQQTANTNNALIQYLQTDEKDSESEGKLKNAVEGFLTNTVMGTAISVIPKVTGNLFRSIKGVFRANTEEEAKVAFKDVMKADTQLQQIGSTVDLLETVKAVKAEADASGQEASELLRSKLSSENLDDADAMLKSLDAGNDIHVNEDGSYAIEVSDWRDAHKVSKEDYISQRGKDELAYCIVAVLNSQIFLLKQGGLQGGYCIENLTQLATMAKEYKINEMVIESNFGDGMFTTLLSPILRKIHPCAVEEIRHNTQKEKRIIDTLEPVMNQHKLIVDKKVIIDDRESIKQYPLEKQQHYSLFYQLTRITKDRGCLGHDDRLDCLAMAVAKCLTMMSIDVEDEIKLRLKEEFEAEIERIYGFSDKEDDSWFDAD